MSWLCHDSVMVYMYTMIEGEIYTYIDIYIRMYIYTLREIYMCWYIYWSNINVKTLSWYMHTMIEKDTYMYIHVYIYVQPIPPRVTFSKAQRSKLEYLFCHVLVKRDVRAFSFELWNSIRKCHPKWDWLHIDETWCVAVNDMMCCSQWHDVLQSMTWCVAVNDMMCCSQCLTLMRHDVLQSMSHIDETWMSRLCHDIYALRPFTCISFAHVYDYACIDYSLNMYLMIHALMLSMYLMIHALMLHLIIHALMTP